MLLYNDNKKIVRSNDLLTILWCNQSYECFIEALRNYPPLFDLAPPDLFRGRFFYSVDLDATSFSITSRQ